MGNVIPFAPTRREVPTPPFAAIAIDDEELDIRLWELTMSGQRGSEEYQRLSEVISRRTSHWDMRGRAHFAR